MKRIALSGGIGSGKSAVTAYLRSRHFTVVDADEIAHQQAQGDSPVVAALVDAFGAGILRDGVFDRAFLAQLVFASEVNRARLNAITHGPIGREMRRQIDEAEGSAVFVAIPLFRPEHRSLGLDEVWMILTDPSLALERLVEQRGMTPADARARIDAQESNDERRSHAALILDNNASLEGLLTQVDQALLDRGLS